LFLVRLLLVGHGLALALAGPAVGAGALSAHGQTAAVPLAAPAADVHQALDAELHFAAQRALHLHMLVDVLADAGLLLIGPVLHLGVGIHTALLEDVQRCAAADAVDVGEADAAPFALG